MKRFVAPFEIREAPLRQYCEVVFAGHDHYKSIELQYLEISDDRRGYVVLMNTHEGFLDILSESSLALDEDWCRNDPSVSHYRLGRVETVDLDDLRLDTGVEGVDARVAFTDNAGRRIEMVVTSASSGPAKSRNLFIPASPRPNVTMLWFLYVFEFAPLRPSDLIDIRIDGQPVTPNKWPWPIGLRRYIQGRYANNIAFFSLNPPKAGPLPFIDGDDAFDLTSSPDAPTIRAWRKRQQDHDIEISFDPPMPAVPASGEAVQGQGSFNLAVDNIVLAKGHYQLSSTDGRVDLAFADVDQYWRPPQNDFSVWMLELYHRLKTGRRRWHWKATTRYDDGKVSYDSTWTLR